MVECGGTVGDIESQPFLEAFRQIELEEGGLNTLYIHVTLAPVLDVVGEQKTKPTQHSVQNQKNWYSTGHIGCQMQKAILLQRQGEKYPYSRA